MYDIYLYNKHDVHKHELTRKGYERQTAAQKKKKKKENTPLFHIFFAFLFFHSSSVDFYLRHAVSNKHTDFFF